MNSRYFESPLEYAEWAKSPWPPSRSGSMSRLGESQTEKKPAGVHRRIWDRYQIYLASTNDKYPKSFDEWLNS